MHMNYGTATWNLFKANMNVLPSDTIVVDLCGTEEQIFASMKPKTRYNIGLARRKGVEVRDMGPRRSASGTTSTRRRLTATACTSTTGATSRASSRAACSVPIPR